MQNLRTRLAHLVRRNEQGVSLVEILVYVTILAVLLSGIIALVVSSTNASSRFTTTTATQAEVNNTQASILRDLSLTQQIFQAGGDHIQFSVAQDNKQYRVTIFSYGGQTRRGEVPAYINTILTDNPSLNSALPVEAAVMSIREEYGNDSAKTITALTKGYDPEAYEDKGLWLFSYYDKDNEVIPLADDKQFNNPTQDVNKISRIAFRVAADAPGRASKVQAETSVTPPLEKTNVSSQLNGTNVVSPGVDPLACPVMEANIPRNTRAAHITWTQVTGATQFYITRSEYRNSTWTEQRTYTIDNPSLTSFTESANELVIGGTYRYNLTLETVKGTVECGQTGPVSVIPANTSLRNINPHAYARTMSGLTANNLTGLNTAGTATSLNSDLTVRGVNRSAATTSPLANARYTTARGLNNQVAFSGTYGALEYVIYRDGVEIARVPANTTGSSTNEPNQRYHYVDGNQSYGDVHNYQVVARNNGGNNPTVSNDGHALFAAAHALISPPADNSTYSVVANDNEVVTNGNVLSSNTITVRATNNVAGFRAKYASSETAADCAVGIPQTDVDGTSAAGYRNDENISLAAANGFLSTVNESVVTQTGIGWGTTTCYRMIPYNDAGSYPYAEGAANTTARVKADQRPERFQINSVDSGTYFYNVDYSENSRLYNPVYRDYGGLSECLLYAGPGKNLFGTDVIYCDGNPNKTSWGGPWGNGNWSPIGAIVPKNGQHQMFRNQAAHQIYGTQQEVIGRWNVSSGARAGYSLTRTVESAPSGRGTIVGYSNTKTEQIPFATGNETNNGIRFSGEFPGVVMSISVDSRAMNGLTRPGITRVSATNPTAGSQKYMFATNPAPSISLRAGYYRHYYAHGTTSATNEMTRPSHGFGGRAYITITVNGAIVLNNASADVTNSAYRFYSGPFVRGDLALYRNITWNSGVYGTLKSAQFIGSGLVNGTSVGTPAGFWPEIYPSYWGNMSGRYAGASALNASSDYYSYWPNTRTILKSGEAIEPFDNEVGSTDIPPTINMDCSLLREAAPDYLDQNCEYGDGIAPAPQNITADRSGASTYLIKWDAVEAATQYRVIINRGATQVLDTTTSNLQLTLTGVTTQNTAYTVIVKAINNAGEGEEGTHSFVSSSVPGQVNNLTATQQANGTTWRASWSAPAGATNYTAQLFKGTTLIQTGNVTGTSYDFTNITDFSTTYRVVVVAKNLAGSGAAREITFTTPNVALSDPTGTMGNTFTTSNTVNTYSPSAINLSGMSCAVGELQSLIRYGSTTIKDWSAIHSVSIPSTFPKHTATTVSVDWRCSYGLYNSDTVTQNIASPVTYARNAPITGLPAIMTTATTPYVTKVGNNYEVQQHGSYNMLMYAPSCDTGWEPFYTVNDAGIFRTQSSSVFVKNVPLTTAQNLSYSIQCKNTSTGELSKATSYSEVITITGKSFAVTPSPTTAVAVSKTNPIAGEAVTLTFPAAHTCPTGFTVSYGLWVGSWVGEPEMVSSTTYQRAFTQAEAALVQSSGMWYSNACVLNTDPNYIIWSSGSSPARTINVITVPAVPATPNVSNLVGQQATVSWTAVPTATSYNVTATTSQGAERTATTTGTSITMPYMSDMVNRNVKFSVSAVNAAGESAKSAQRSVKTLIGDYTRDGNPDLTVNNNQNGIGYIYPGNGAGGLQGTQVSLGGGWNEGFHARPDVDIDNDGHVDAVALSNALGNIYFYKFNGTSIVSRTLVASGIEQANGIILTVTDYNKDGNLDIMYASDGSLYFMAGNGDGTFQPSIVSATGLSRLSQNGGAGDYNGDGHLDVMIKYTNSTFRMFYGNSQGIFTPGFTSGTGWGVSRTLEGWDVNNTGRDGFIAVNGSGFMNVFTANVSGTNITGFNSAQNGNGWGGFYDYSAMRDYNKNGIPDFMVRNGSDLYFYNGGNQASSPWWHAGSPTQSGFGGWGVMTLWGATPHVTVENNQTPFGDINSVTANGGGKVHIRGWSIDTDTINPLSIHVYIGGVGHGAVLSNVSRPDVANVYPTWGAARGYDATINTSLRGNQSVCIYIIDNANNGSNPGLGCRTVNIT